jgi:hypothetical protein
MMSTDLKDHTLVRPENQKWLKAIGIYQIAGAGIGLIILLISFLLTSGLYRLLALPGLLLFGLSVYAGIQCIQLKENCIKLSMINQALQIVSFSAGMISFQYISGLAFQPHISSSEGTVSFIFQLNFSNFSFHFDNNAGEYSLGINLVAIGLFYKLNQVRNAYETALWRREFDKNAQK